MLNEPMRVSMADSCQGESQSRSVFSKLSSVSCNRLFGPCHMGVVLFTVETKSLALLGEWLESCFWNLGVELALRTRSSAGDSDIVLVVIVGAENWTHDLVHTTKHFPAELWPPLKLFWGFFCCCCLYVFKKGSSLCLKVLHHALGRKEELLCLGWAPA